MVDCVMIDPAYDGKVFNIVMSDIPEKKTDLVKGVYELPLPGVPTSVSAERSGRDGARPSEDKTTVAIKIVDMLGEEVLVVREV